MRNCLPTRVWLLAILTLFIGLTSAVPNLGIRADFIDATGKTTDRDIQSYSGIIKFEDGAIPLDKTRMTDAKLINLAKVAYNEMVAIWRTRQLSEAALPGAMAALAYKDKIYFASAIRAMVGMVKLSDIPKGSVREVMQDALTNGAMVHQHGGGCAEINILELIWDDLGKNDPERDPRPRVAIWVRPREGTVGSSEINAKPCTWQGRSGMGYGCAEIVQHYNIEAIDNSVQPDAAGEDDWKFSIEANPRPPCTR